MKSKLIAQYLLSVALLTLGAIIAGVCVYAFASSFLKNAEYDDINNVANATLKSFEYYISESDDKDAAQAKIKEHFKYYSSSFNTSFYILDENGDIILSAEADNLKYKAKTIGRLINATEFNIVDNKLIIYKKEMNSSLKSGNVYFVAIRSADNYYNNVMRLGSILCVAVTVIFAVFAVIFFVMKRKAYYLFLEINDIADCYIKNGKCDQKFPQTTDEELRPIILSMNKMTDIIASANKRNLEFMSNVSHELKTPITIINGFVTGILDGTINRDDIQKYLVRISEQTNRMIRLLGTMMKISGIESGEMQLNRQMVNLTNIFIESLFMYEKQIDDKNVSVEGFDSAKTMIYGDKDMLYQIVYNLVDNAVKFVNPGGQIKLCAHADEHNIYIHFGNTGKGISGNEMSRIFDRFYKTDFSRSHDTSGVGLGLSIVKKFVSFHHGSIILKSTKDKYTFFDLTFPIDKFNVRPSGPDISQSEQKIKSNGGEENER